MAGAARVARRQTAGPGLLILAAACAASQAPPGGPPDVTAPVLLAVEPDSSAPHPGFRGPVVFRFDEVVSERSATNLAELFLVSPRPEELDVDWKRDLLEVRPKGGWRAGTVYRVSLLPGLQDLRNNRLREGHELVFSTGPEIPDTRVSGTVINWPAARLAARALVEAIAGAGTADSLVYLGQTDSSGAFTLRALPPGDYVLVATLDENTNRRRDRREAFDSVTLRLDSSATAELWAFVHDSVGPQVRTATRVDSVTVRLEFSQTLRPGDPDSSGVAVLLLPDSTPVPVARVLLPAVFDSLRAAEARVRDSLAAAAADSAAAADTTGNADTAAAAGRRRPAPVARGRAPARQGAAEPDTSRAAELLGQRPPLVTAWVVVLVEPLSPGGRYLFQTRVANPNGAVAESRAVLAVPDTVPGPAAR